jgi:LysM repeat protein
MRPTALVLGLLLGLALPGAPAAAQPQTDTTYTVQEGDTLYGIAQTVGVSVRALRRWNDLEDSTLRPGQTLRVRPPAPDAAAAPDAPPETDPSGPDPSVADTSAPAAPPDDAAPAADTAAGPPPFGRHAVKPGETFVTLALRLGTTADTLFAMNDSTTAPLSPGRPLRLPRRFGPPTHTVRSGQTLYSIAGQYGVSVRALKAENDLSSDTLRPGQRLQVPRRAGVELPPPGQWAAPDTTGPVARYPEAFAGRLTASGTAYDPEALVVSHPSLPFDSVVLLSAQDPARHTFARVIDRGPVETGALLDVSAAVADALRLGPDRASPSVALRVVWRAE